MPTEVLGVSLAEPPGVETGAAEEVTAETAVLHGTVDPEGEEVTSCTFEYGQTTSYGSSVPCSPTPGSSKVKVTASLSGLVTNAIYHFRITVTTAAGTTVGHDRTFTLLLTSSTGETTNAAVPAKATDGSLSVEASGGTGRVTIGQYGPNIGGPSLVHGSGSYFQVYHSASASFKKIEYKDCELDGAKTLWWDNPASGWEPISEKTAVYTESPTPCITVTATESTTPSITQLLDPRHVGGPADAEEYGKCEPFKHGVYGDSGCTTPDLKKGQPKGKYEWFPAPVACFGQKKGHFGDAGCTQEKYSENKKHERKYKGSYERGLNTLAGTVGITKLAVQGSGTLECASGSLQASLEAAKTGKASLTLSGCSFAAQQCTTTGQASGTITTCELELLLYEEGGKAYVGLFGETIASFSCGSTSFTLSGGLSAEASGSGAMSNAGQWVFVAGVGDQLHVRYGSTESDGTLTGTVKTSSEQPLEIHKAS